MENNSTHRLEKIEDTLNFLVNSFKIYLGISPEDDFLETDLIFKAQEKSYKISLVEEILEMDNYDVILETLNQKGAPRGVF